MRTGILYSRSAIGLWCLATLIVASGVTCPVLDFWTDLWVNITSDYRVAVGTTSTAAAVASGGAGTLTYQWSITSPGRIISGENELLVSFSADSPGSSTLLITVTDSVTGESVTNAVQIEFFEENNGTPSTQPAEPLQADAGADQTVTVGNTVLLLGSASGGLTSSWPFYLYWRQASGPVQKISPESYFEGPVITVIGTTPGNTVFELVLRDSTGEIATDTVNVVVTAP